MVDETEIVKKKKKEKKEKKEKKKKEKKRKRKNDDEEAESEVETPVKAMEVDEGSGDGKTKEKVSTKEKRLSKKKEKDELMKKVPKVDEHGIAYTKLQVRRMMKRVKRGLPPVPTEEEERERLRNEAQLRREEEAELAGMLFKKDDDDEEEDEGGIDKEAGDDDDDKDKEDDDDEGEEAEDNTKKAAPSKEEVFKKAKEEMKQRRQEEGETAKKKARRSKAVPDDYVCMACKNKHTPAHWIYDCPEKVTVRGTNQKKKKLRGLNEPDSRKVFVSGLPFDVKHNDVEQMFQGCGKVSNCRLVKFPDTGRCKGQAYVCFTTDEAAQKALKLSGTVINNEGDSKKKGKKAAEPKRKELKLKVSKVLSRKVTKGK